MRFSRIPALMLLALGLSSLPAAAAADKEHRQLMAEIRMLQEQQQQVQALLGNLSDALKAVSAKLDDQSSTMRKAMADQTLAINGIGDNVRVVREKVDDTNVRIASVSQEIEGLRQAISSTQPLQPTAPVTPGTEQPPVSGTTPPTAGQTPPSNNPMPIGVSPQRMWDASWDDYTAGRYDLAITGFQSFIQAFPRLPRAAEAQFYIGQSFFSQGKWPEAQREFQKVVADYPQSDSVRGAYYKLGQTYERLNQSDLAKKAYETVIKNYPGTTEAQLASQSLERLNRKE